MKYESKEIKLKNGQTAYLRMPTAENAVAVIAYMKTVTGETGFLMSYPEEFVITEEIEARILASLETAESQRMILCEIDGRIAGN